MKREELRELDIDSIEVNLKPIFGIKPRIYLTVIYSILILTVLFFLLIFPGINNHGTYYYITSSAPGSAVFVDDVYAGSTPNWIFIEKGNHKVKTVHPFYTESIQSIKTPARVLFTLFKKNRDTLHADLTIHDAEGLYKAALTETAQWGLIHDYSNNYFPRPVISQTAAELVQSGNSDLAKSFVNNTLIHISNETLFEDWLKAASIVEQGSVAKASLFQGTVLFNFTSLMKTHPNLIFHLLSIEGNSNYRKEIKKSSFYAKANKAVDNLPSAVNISSDKKMNTSFNSMNFVFFPGGTFTSGAAKDNNGSNLKGENNHPLAITVEPFYILDREVTAGMYREFLKNRKTWVLENKEILVTDNLVTEVYMSGWENKGNNDPADYVSWYAANAFCDYINTKLPVTFKNAGYKVSLPTESQWEYAAVLSDPKTAIFNTDSREYSESATGRTADKNGIYDLFGNVAEWCSNWYTPADRFFTDSSGNSAVSEVTGVQKAVRGGSWANDHNAISPAVRGFQPPEWCTPYLGFRIVISR